MFCYTTFMKKIIIVILILAVVGIAAFAYLTRPVKIDTASPVVEGTSETAQMETGTPASPSSAETYKISPEKSTVGFTINEELRGSPFTVQGATSAVSGTATLSENNGAIRLSLGTISIDARTFKTDSAQRDGAIARLILESTEPGNETITFKADGPVTLPESPREGSAYPFSATGTLTISGKSQTATFTGTIAKSSDALTVKVTSPAKRSDYGLTIPNIPFVANVPDAFMLTANIVATK